MDNRSGRSRASGARPPRLTVIFASHNGAGTLDRTLQAFARLKEPAGGDAFIGVDNASNDETAAILDAYRSKLNLTALSEPRLGKPRALERAIPQAAGDLIVFTDDDVIAEPEWLTAYVSAAEQFPDIVFFAGQVRHHWEKTPARWLERLAEVGMSFGGTILTQPAGPYPAAQVKGANFMVRRALLEEIRFRTDLVWGSDTDFALRAARAGHPIRFVPEACVRHIVRAHQMRLLPVLARYFRVGRGNERANPTRPGFRMARNLAKSGLQLLAGNTHKARIHLLNCAMNGGGAFERWRGRTAKATRGHDAASIAPG